VDLKLSSRLWVVSGIVLVAGVAAWRASSQLLRPDPNPYAIDQASDLSRPSVQAAVTSQKYFRSASSNRRQLSGTRAFSITSKLPVHEVSALTYIQHRLDASRDGDATATYEIHLQISACRRVIKANDSQLFKAYAAIGMQASYAQSVERTLNQCADVVTQAELMNRAWLAIAAEQGSVEAALIYATAPEEIGGDITDLNSVSSHQDAIRENAIRYLENALAEGSLDAVAALGRFYEEGIHTNRNLILAYAHKRTLQRMDPKLLEKDELHNLRISMSVSEISQAEELSRDIYRSCCSP